MCQNLLNVFKKSIFVPHGLLVPFWNYEFQQRGSPHIHWAAHAYSWRTYARRLHRQCNGRKWLGRSKGKYSIKWKINCILEIKSWAPDIQWVLSWLSRKNAITGAHIDKKASSFIWPACVTSLPDITLYQPCHIWQCCEPAQKEILCKVALFQFLQSW